MKTTETIETKVNLTAEELKEAARLARNAYMSQWKRKNRDKVRGYNQRYWQRRAEKAMAAAVEGGKEI